MRPCILSLDWTPERRSTERRKESPAEYTCSCALKIKKKRGRALLLCLYMLSKIARGGGLRAGARDMPRRVENNGFEPLTPCLQSRCSSQLS